MLALQLICAAIVAQYLWVTMRLERPDDARRLPLRLLLLALAAVLGEDTVIRAYGFYQYAPGWLLIDRVPLMVALIWPAVIYSDWRLASCLIERPRLVPLVGALFVLADAALIEPIAVRSGLWSWNEPGLFGVPPIGVVGWAFFAAIAMAVLQRGRGGGPLLLLAPPALVHPALVGAWWLLFRWVNRALPAAFAVGLVWVLSVATSAGLWRAGVRRRVPLAALATRIPAACLFFVLLALQGRDDPLLVAYAVAFAPPYLALMDLGRPADAGR